MRHMRRARAGDTVTKPTNPRVPAARIRWLLDGVHVAASYGAVALDIAERLPGATSDQDAADTIRYALDVHADNRGMYADVMGGRI